MRALIYFTLAYIIGLAVAVDFLRNQGFDNEAIARHNFNPLGKLKGSVHTDDPVPGLEPDDSSDDDDFPEEPRTPEYD